MLFKLNKAKAIEALLFICNRLDVADKHKISKILYYADKSHLNKYGRLITGDKYIKMEYGPVPSWIYDLIKENAINSQIVEVQGFNVKPLRRENIEELSESDIECLKNSLYEYGNKSFPELTEESHDATWKAGKMNRKFTKNEFLLTFPNKTEIEDFIKNKY